MRDALRDGDYYRSGHGPGASSVGSPSDRTPPPQRSGQLADYYPLIAQAVNRLEHSTAETRQTIYDRARAAMAAQLRIVTPALPESVINREQLALERAIRKVETESLGYAPTRLQPSSRQPNVPPGSIREIGDEQAKRVSRSIDDDQAGEDSAFAKRLAMDKPDLAAELDTLQKEIRRDRRGSRVVRHARKLVPLTFMGLIVLSVAASGAY
jgi:hypothetical protein